MVDYMPEWIERGNLRYKSEVVSAMCTLLTGKFGRRVMQAIEDSIKNEATTKSEWNKLRRRK